MRSSDSALLIALAAAVEAPTEYLSPGGLALLAEVTAAFVDHLRRSHAATLPLLLRIAGWVKD